MTREREFKPAQVCKGKGPKVATCEARFFFCKISAKFGFFFFFFAHFWAETRPSKPVQAKVT